jgi:hypothetical protein
MNSMNPINPRNLIFLTGLLLILVTAHVSSSQIPVESLIPKKEIAQGWALTQGPQVYTKKTLFEHINGQAELFFKYGFQKSAFAVYQERKNRKNEIEVDIYDMGSVLHAFGVFSRFRNEDRSAGIGLDSYFDDHSLIFYKGKYFVMLYATELDSSALKQWATMVSMKISDPSPAPKEIGYFANGGVKPGSIQYFSEGLLGYQFLKRGFQGTFTDKVKDEVKEFKLFLAIFENPQEAMIGLKNYREDLSKKGKVDSVIPPLFGPSALKGEDPYRGKILIVPKGSYLAGVVGFEDDKNGENLLAEFMQMIQ